MKPTKRKLLEERNEELALIRQALERLVALSETWCRAQFGVSWAEKNLPHRPDLHG